MLGNGCVIVDYISQDTQRNTKRNWITKGNSKQAKLMANTVKDSAKCFVDNDCLHERVPRSCMKHHLLLKEEAPWQADV